MDNYTKSNNTEVIKAKFSSKTKQLFELLRNANSLSQFELQLISDNICHDLKVSNTKITYSGVQNNTTVNGRLKCKTLGTYTSGIQQIRIFQYTAVKKKEVSPKTALDTLIHELCHHFDYTILKLDKSIHSAGFYKRITSVKQALMS